MKSLALRIALLFFLSGVVIILIIGYIERKTISTYEKDIPYLRLSENVKNETIHGHLLLEKYLRGEEHANSNADVLARFTKAAALLQTVYDGKENELGKFEKSDNEDIRAIIKESIILTDKLSALAKDRMANKATVIVTTDSLGNTITNEVPEDSGVILNFNNEFNKLQGSLNKLMEIVSTDLQTDRNWLNIITWGSILLLSIIFIGLTLMLYRMQLRRDRSVVENSQRLQQQAKAVASLSSFIESISAGNFTQDLEMDGGDSDLTKSLLNMRDKLRDNAEDDRKRNWSTSGLAQIGEILRSNTQSTEVLYDAIIRFVVKYTKSNQGGLFLLNDDEEKEKSLSLVAFYAFERKKYLNKNVVIGEGLVGQCFLEGEYIYLREVPQEYITVTSGLGGATPNALLIMPLKVNDNIYGVLELATFTEFKPYEIELVSKLSESIASTISSVRINESTRILLEKTQQQAEEMRAQEEEMRQNMEELEATQEEMRRKEKHIEVMLEGEKQRNEFNVKSRAIVISLSKTKEVVDGKWKEARQTIVKPIGEQMNVTRTSIWLFNEAANKIVCDVLYNHDQQAFEDGKEIEATDAPFYFKALKSGEPILAKDAVMQAETKELSEVYLRPLSIQSVINIPFFNEGKVAGFISCEQQSGQKEWTDDHVEFLKSCADLIAVTLNTVKINDKISQLNEAQQTLQTIIDNLPRAIFWKDRELRIQGCNKLFARTGGFNSHEDLIGKTDFDMPWRKHAETFRADDLAVIESKESKLDLEERNVNSEGVEFWTLTSKVPVFNAEGNVVAVLGMFEDITDRKRKESDVAARLKELDDLKKRLENLEK